MRRVLCAAVGAAFLSGVPAHAVWSPGTGVNGLVHARGDVDRAVLASSQGRVVGAWLARVGSGQVQATVGSQDPGGAWGTPTVVSSEGADATDVAVATNGATIAVAWVEDQAGMTRVHVAVGGAPDALTDATPSPAAKPVSHPSVAIDAAGRVIVTWDEATHSTGYAIRPPGGTFGAARAVGESTLTATVGHALAVTPQGHAYLAVVVGNPSNGDVLVARAGPGAVVFDLPSAIAGVRVPIALATGRDDDAALTYPYGDGIRLAFAHAGALPAAGTTTIAGSAGATGGATPVVGRGGAVALGIRATHAAIVVLSPGRGRPFAERLRIDAGLRTVGDIGVALNDRGDVAAIVQTSAAGEGDAVLARLRRTDAGAESVATLLLTTATSTARSPLLATGADDAFSAAWVAGDGTSEHLASATAVAPPLVSVTLAARQRLTKAGTVRFRLSCRGGCTVTVRARIPGRLSLSLAPRAFTLKEAGTTTVVLKVPRKRLAALRAALARRAATLQITVTGDGDDVRASGKLTK